MKTSLVQRSLKPLSLIITTLLLSSASPLELRGTTLGILIAQAQTQTNQDITELERLSQEGIQQYHQGQFQEALEIFQQVLAIVRERGDKTNEMKTLTNIAVVYEAQGQYPKALEFYEQLLVVVRELEDKHGEGTTLNNIAAVYGSQGQYSQALEFYKQALALFRELDDKAAQATALNNIAIVYHRIGQYSQAIETYQQLLTLVRELNNQADEGTTLNNLALIHRKLGQYAEAMKFFEQALLIKKALDDREGVGKILSNIAVIYREQSQYPKALEFFEQALAVYKQINNKTGEITTLSYLAVVYDDLGQYNKASELSEQALALYKESLTTDKDGAEEAKSLNNLGEVYRNLKQYAKALEMHQQALAISREVGDKAEEATTLNNMALVYGVQQQYSQALEFFNQALAIARAVDDKVRERTILSNLAAAYQNLKQYPQALESYQQALVIQREMGDQARQGTTLTKIGSIYFHLDQPAKAQEFYLQALAVERKVNDKAGESTIFSNIGILLEQQQPELAVVFYKQAVNIIEEIRTTIQVLPREEQESYTKTVENTYRSLANLLLSQGRILEAQRVLELLKLQEIRNFTRDARVGEQTLGSPLTLTEAGILEKYDSLITFGQQLYECEQTQCSELSQMSDERQVLTEQYFQRIQTFEAEVRDRRSQDDAFFDPSKLAKAQEIIDAQPGTVLIYPFVLDDKIWLLWAAKGGIVRSVEVPVGRTQLGNTVLEFRQLLQKPSSDITKVKETSKQLYEWLIKPIESELKANQIQNLVFALDRVTRYIPMSALFDGEKYLIENYSVSTVLSADLTNMRDRLPPGTQNTSILALGLSNAFPGFNPLPNVPAELDAIVQGQADDAQGIYPGKEFLNSDFDFRALRDNLLGNQLLHIATHGTFVPGRQEESYLLLGTGEKLIIPQIKVLQELNDVHLVVLSACETALGGPDADGVEISGISYYFLNSGAKAVMASLWLVNDASTSQLMQQFYSNLAQGTEQAPITKAEALRQAQLSLLQGDTPVAGNAKQQASLTAEALPGSPTTSTNVRTSRFSHPYYWAPFILIGNSL